MYYLDKLKHLLVMERDCKRFKVYNSRTGKWMFSVPEKSTGEGGAFIAADYVEHGNIKFVATTTNNNQINFWDSNNYIFRDRMNTNEIQLTGKYPMISSFIYFNFSQMVWRKHKSAVHWWSRLCRSHVRRSITQRGWHERRLYPSEERRRLLSQGRCNNRLVAYPRTWATRFGRNEQQISTIWFR